jgi:hypothetical protein
VGREARIGGRSLRGLGEAHGRRHLYLELRAAGFCKHRAGLAEDRPVWGAALDLEAAPHGNDAPQPHLGRTSELAGKQAADIASERDAVAAVLVGKSPVALIYREVVAHPRCGESTARASDRQPRIGSGA